MALIERFPGWLYQALGVREPKLPSEIDSGSIALVLDSYQGGWGIADWRVINPSVGNSQPAGNLEIIAADESRVSLCLGIHVTDATGEDTPTGQYILRGRDPVSGASIRYQTITTAAPGEEIDTQRWNGVGGLFPILLPPGIQLRVDHPATGVGESVIANALIGETRAGFKFL